MDNTREQSEFNYAVKYLERINILFYRANIAAMELDAHNWYHSLVTLFRELSTKMNIKEIDDFNLITNELSQQVSVNMENFKGMRSIDPILYKNLHDFEMKLRKIMKESGLEGRTLDDPGSVLG